MKLTALTLTQNASLVLSFGSEADRDEALDILRTSLPREVHSKVRSGVAGEGKHVLTIRVQDISHPVTITFAEGAPTIAETANLDVTSGRETFNRLKSLPRDQVPGANADAHTEERPTSSGVNLTQGVPGAVNNDPSTATNGGYEGSPAQAIASATDGTGPTPGGFQGPDKAAIIKGAAPGTAHPAVTAESLHPEGQTQDAGAVAVSKAAVADEKDAKAKAREARLAERAAKQANLAAKSAERSSEAAEGKTEGAHDLDGTDEKSGKAGDAADEKSKLV